MPLTQFNVWRSDLQRQLKIIFLQDKIILILFLFGLIINLALYLIIYLGAKATVESLILHYSVYFGIDLIGQWHKLYFMPLVGSFLWLVNSALTLFFYQKERPISYLLAGATLIAELLLLIGGALLVWVNY